MTQTLYLTAQGRDIVFSVHGPVQRFFCLQGDLFCFEEMNVLVGQLTGLNGLDDVLKLDGVLRLFHQTDLMMPSSP